jgi:predicted PhzF superfamily epimerase YddE/YHI9
MDFPSKKALPIDITKLMEQAIGCAVKETYIARDMLLIVENEQQIRNIIPNFEMLKQFKDAFGIIVSAKGDGVDFVSRYFAPNVGIPEDSVTGASHYTLIPYWSKKLDKQMMEAMQLSKRGGVLFCQDEEERVKISGRAILYLQGEISA